ncbi:MAG TPA: MBL fold metallo-hydrolase [Hypericibacter adhaerens]|uniref:MBL fold metallo-hydrolase n=1 Tax=Hypericibacter adhaerens TaxID=2602016 RepID=A0A5J6N417_9PROT|nr:MBL fold metallo-hydrolase [Hypericibacter adhaerens]QEX23665.1 MBL fold metallo-hydrolase [Hypericibacter adhaerens]HWA42129.1 MBL fold metallo-hydrolase [Hypericibacter adhaerens]
MALQVADHWFELRRLADGVTFLWEPHVAPLLRCNIWHVRGRDRDLIIDTGMGICSLRTFAKDILDKPVSAVATHAHIDHIGGHHEFEDCIAHRLEAEGLQAPRGDYTLADPGFDPADMATLRIPSLPDYKIEGAMITALPSADYDIRSFRIRPARQVRAVEEGDVIDLGDRVFEVLHLPGHSPGSIGLLERKTETLFSGDAVYDGPLFDQLHHSSRSDYVRTLHRLRNLPVRTIHAGHDPSFGRDRLIELIDEQLARWGEAERAAG